MVSSIISDCSDSERSPLSRRPTSAWPWSRVDGRRPSSCCWGRVRTRTVRWREAEHFGGCIGTRSRRWTTLTSRVTTRPWRGFFCKVIIECFLEIFYTWKLSVILPVSINLKSLISVQHLTKYKPILSFWLKTKHVNCKFISHVFNLLFDVIFLLKPTSKKFDVLISALFWIFVSQSRLRYLNV